MVRFASGTRHKHRSPGESNEPRLLCRCSVVITMSTALLKLCDALILGPPPSFVDLRSSRNFARGALPVRCGKHLIIEIPDHSYQLLIRQCLAGASERTSPFLGSPLRRLSRRASARCAATLGNDHSVRESRCPCVKSANCLT